MSKAAIDASLAAFADPQRRRAGLRLAPGELPGRNENPRRCDLRSIPPAIRRALKRLDGSCRFPGCTATRFVDAHHAHLWADELQIDPRTIVPDRGGGEMDPQLAVLELIQRE